MKTSYEILVNDFKNIGLSLGDMVVVHSSLKSMGHVEGGAECVIDALKAVVGDEGTIIFPTFTYSTSYADSYFSNKDTPSCVGYITEVFRHMDGVIRTNHPTHSVAIWGKYRRELAEGVELDDTPMGVHSPYRKFADYGAKIIMLGCSLSHNSFMHAMEEEAAVPYALRDHQEYTVVDEAGNSTTRRIRRHNFVRPNGKHIHQRYDRSLDVLDAGDYSMAQIHGAPSVMIRCDALKAKACAKMAEDPLYFVDDPHGQYSELAKS